MQEPSEPHVTMAPGDVGQQVDPQGNWSAGQVVVTQVPAEHEPAPPLQMAPTGDCWGWQTPATQV